MKRPKNQPCEGDSKSDRLFKIVVAGEDVAAVARAQKLSIRVTAELKPGFEISREAWKFETVGNLPGLKPAAKGIAKADLLNFATIGAVEPAAHVKSWIESSLPRKPKGVTALVAVGDRENHTLHEISPLRIYLRRAAAKCGADCLTNSSGEWGHDFEFAAATPHYQQERQSS